MNQIPPDSIYVEKEWNCFRFSTSKTCKLLFRFYGIISINEKGIRQFLEEMKNIAQRNKQNLTYFHKQPFLFILKHIIYILSIIRMSTDRSFVSNSTFNWENSNIKQLLKPIDFDILKRNDSSEPFCHYTHKNLKWKQAPFNSQDFMITLPQLTNVKHIAIDNFTHGSEMTICVAQTIGGQKIEVYRDKFICKGKTLKKQLKQIDLGALPCQQIQISVTKGSKLSSKNIWVVGVQSKEIEEHLGTQYFKLLVINPLKIMYTQ